MWNLKSVLLFVASLFVVIIISMSWANAEEKKITPKDFGTAIAEAPSKIGNFFGNEVEKTKEYQKKSWAEMKTKWPFTMFNKAD